MNPKTKQTLKKIFKIVWIALGVFFAFFLFNAVIKAHNFSGNGFAAIGAGIAVGILLAIAMFLFAVYIVSTGLFFLIRWLVRMHRKRKTGGKKDD